MSDAVDLDACEPLAREAGERADAATKGPWCDAILALCEEVRRLRPRHEGAGHPWGDFLHHRARALRWYCEEFDSDPAEIAKVFSMDPGQVADILRYVDSRPDMYPVEAVSEGCKARVPKSKGIAPCRAK